jgi:Tol biopolymer transport system component
LLRRDPDSASDKTAWTEVGELIPDFATASWSPDGRLLLGRVSYPLRYSIYDVAAGEVLDGSSPPTRSSYEASWFPDSERILYWDRATQHYLVWNWRTGDTSPLPGLNRVPGDPMISPDGRTLFVMEQNVDGEIWMLTLDRGNDAN